MRLASVIPLRGGLFLLLAALAGCFGSLAPGRAWTQPGSTGVATRKLDALPLSFVEDGERLGFHARSSRGALTVGENEVIFHPGPRRAGREDAPGAVPTPLRLRFRNARRGALPEGLERLPGVVHLLAGSNPSAWKRGLRTYARLRARGVYPGVDVIHYGQGGDLEFDFVVAPGADPSPIELEFDGATSVETTASGDLRVRTAGSEFLQQKPYVYQEIAGERHIVDAGYVLETRSGGAPTVRFQLGAYSRDAPLVIDPVFEWAGYLGGPSADDVKYVGVTPEGNLQVIGTAGSGFPQVNPAPAALQGPLFVSVISPDGRQLLSSTYVGKGATSLEHVVVDGQGRIWMTGYTNTSTLPLVNPYQSTKSGSVAAFILRLSPDAQAVTYGTYFSFSTERGEAMDVAGDEVVLAGTTLAVNLPKIKSCQPSLGGGEDAFVARFDTAAAGPAQLKYCSYLGGADSDTSFRVVYDPAGPAYTVVGTTSSPNFPLASPYQATMRGTSDYFLSRIVEDDTGSTLARSTYFGGSAGGTLAEVVRQGTDLVLCGNTSSPDWPMVDPVQTTRLGSQDAFLSRFDASLQPVKSTYFGATATELVYGALGGADGSIYLLGNTSAGHPTAGLNWAGGGLSVIKLNSQWTQTLLWSSLGTNGQFRRAAVDGAGNLYLAGSTSSAFPVRGAPFQGSLSNGTDVVLMKISPGETSTTAIELAGFRARRSGAGAVLLEWQTGREATNLGFNLYRDSGGAPGGPPLNDALIGGSALLAGGRAPLPGGYGYAWWDHSPAGTGYWLEDVDLDGTRTLHGPFPIRGATGGDAPPASPPLGAADAEGWTYAGAAARVEPGVPPPHRFAGRPGLRISVRKEGWYGLPLAELRAAPALRHAAPATWRLYAPTPAGLVEMPAAFSAGRLEFYAFGADTRYSGRRDYWLMAGRGPGLRVPIGGGKRFASAPAGATPHVFELCERTVYFPALANGSGGKFFGGLISPQEPEGLERFVDASGLAGSLQPAALRVDLQGVLQAPRGVTSHRVSVTLNGNPLGEVRFNGLAPGSATFAVLAGLLTAGPNRVVLQARGGPLDYTLLDRLRLTYPRRTEIGTAQRILTAPGQTPLRLTAMTPGVRVFDVTDPLRPSELRTVTERGTGSVVAVPGGRSAELRRLQVVPAGSWQAPEAVEHYTPPAWLDPAFLASEGRSGARLGGGDWVAIAPRDWLPVLGPLVERRRSEGFRPVLVAVEDLLAAFSAGQKDPIAFRRFLEYATAAWKRKPSHVLLLGDASADPRGYLEGDGSDLVPTRLVDTESMEAAWDDGLFADPRTGACSVHVGRLPARDPGEVELMVRKTLAAAPPESGPAVLVTGFGRDHDFAGLTAEVRALLPAGQPVTEIRAGQSAGGALRASLNAGAGLLHYVGHGGNDAWAGPLLYSQQARELVQSRLPLCLSMTCLTGAVHEWRSESLAEALLRSPRGGAWGVWASSSLTYADLAAVMDRAFFQALRQSGASTGRPARLTLGEAVSEARAGVPNLDVRRSWVLLADPAVPVR